MSIQTPFESSGGSAWTTFAEGESFVDDVISLSGRASKLLIGRSFYGHPIHAVAVGYPSPPDIRTLSGVPLFVASQHGYEETPREAALSLLRDLAFSANPADHSRLAECPIVLVPTASPDGTIANSRYNGDGADLNRDHVRLAQPENRALAALLSLIQPGLIYDGHEGSSAAYELSGFYTSPAAAPLLNDFGGTLESAVASLNPSRSTGLYDATDHEGTLLTASLLLGIPAMLMEVPSPHDVLQKHACHLECMAGMYGHYCDNRADYLTTRDAALEHYAAEGAMSYAPIYAFESGAIQPPRGYRVAPGVADDLLAAHGVEYIPGSDGIGNYYVPMAQARAPVIPLLFDGGAPRPAFPADRVEDAPGYAAGQKQAETIRDYLVNLDGPPVRPRAVKFHDGTKIITTWS